MGRKTIYLTMVLILTASLSGCLRNGKEDSKSAEWPDKAYFALFITNHGNVVEDVEVLSSESLRGWTVNVDFDEFELAPGETKEVQVSVVPPSELLEDDTYRFTVTVQPEGLPVAGEPIDLQVTSVMPSASEPSIMER